MTAGPDETLDLIRQLRALLGIRVQTEEELLAVHGRLCMLFLAVYISTGKAVHELPSVPPSPGYEPFLIQAGWNPFTARLMAKLVVKSGKRKAEERKRIRAVYDAIRFLGKRRLQKRSILRRAELLLAAWDETSIIETIFDGAGLSETEFVSLLKSVVEGRDVDRLRITEIAATLASVLSVSRGRKVSAASAAHQFFLEEVAGSTKPRAYTWSDLERDFTDSMTTAARLEFHDPDFDPRPAHRRVKVRRGTKISDYRKPMSRTA